MNIPSRRLFALVALFVLFVTAGVGLRHRAINVDFVAFLCGGESVLHHADPYAMQPLYACEQRRFVDLGRSDLGAVVTPSPLPVYAFGPFAALSLLPTRFALATWDLLLIGSMILSIVLIRSLTRFSVPTIVAAMFIGGIYISLALGQLVPVIIAAIVVTAWAVERENDMLAGIVASVTMCEPNIGLPVCLAVFCIRAKARIPLLAMGVLFAAISVFVAPPAQTIAYFHETLPAHAGSEIRNDEQLSLTHLLALAGASDRTALAAGSLSYLFTMLFGVASAVIIARSRSLQHIAVLVAPACATVGGTYLHVQQFTILSILALFVCAYVPQSSKARYGLMLVALPLIAAGSVIDVLLFTCIAAVMSAELFAGNVMKVAQMTGLTLLITGIVHAIRIRHHETAEQISRMHADVAIATRHAVIPEDVWRVFINEHVFTLLGWNAIAFDVPLVIGTVCVIMAAFDCRRNAPIGEIA